MQPCLSNYTIPSVVELKTIVLYCRRNARFPCIAVLPENSKSAAARFFICPASHSCSAHQKPFYVLTIPDNAFWSGAPVWTSLAFISNFQMTSCPRSRALLAITLRCQINGQVGAVEFRSLCTRKVIGLVLPPRICQVCNFFCCSIFLSFVCQYSYSSKR